MLASILIPPPASSALIRAPSSPTCGAPIFLNDHKLFLIRKISLRSNLGTAATNLFNLSLHIIRAWNEEAFQELAIQSPCSLPAMYNAISLYTALHDIHSHVRPVRLYLFKSPKTMQAIWPSGALPLAGCFEQMCKLMHWNMDLPITRTQVLVGFGEELMARSMHVPAIEQVEIVLLL